jgi:site-specific DNA recombinase
MMRSASRGARRSAKVRCAVYTRKSSEEGLDQEFNSLLAPREAGNLANRIQQHCGTGI